MKEIERIPDYIQIEPDDIPDSEYVDREKLLMGEAIRVLRGKVNELVDAVNFLRNIHFT